MNLLLTSMKRHVPSWAWQLARKLHKSFVCYFHRCVVRYDSSRAQKLICSRIRDIRSSSNSVRVGFYVSAEHLFTLRRVFDLMMNDAGFDPWIIPVPIIFLRSDEDIAKGYESNLSLLREKYAERVLDPRENGEWMDVSDRFDIVCCTSPYDFVVKEIYTPKFLARKGVPVFFAKYFFDAGTISDNYLVSIDVMSYLWKFYLDNDFGVQRLKHLHANFRRKGRLVVAGVPQLDAIAKISVRPHDRIRIVLAPHQSVLENEGLNLGNFPKYAEFVLALPSRYPQIDWVFRPHPLMFHKMISGGIWTRSQVEDYIAKLKSFPNLEYQTSGSVYETFMNSDALIEDSGSFIGEYYYTGKPHCYVIKSEEHLKTQFADWGLEMLSHLYKADSEVKIIDFIEQVVLAGKDIMKDERDEFARHHLAINYPHASEVVFQDLKEALNRKL